MDPFPHTGDGLNQFQERGEDGLLLGKEPDENAELSDVLERVIRGHPEPVSRNGPRRHYQILPDYLRWKNQRTYRFDKGSGVLVVQTDLVCGFQQDVRIDEERFSGRHSRR